MTTLRIWVRRDLRLLAFWLMTYPRSRANFRIRSRCSFPTRVLPERARETVDILTPAIRAMSLILGIAGDCDRLRLGMIRVFGLKRGKSRGRPMSGGRAPIGRG